MSEVVLGRRVIQLFTDRDVADVFGTQDPLSSLKPVALSDTAATSTTSEASGEFDKSMCWLAAQGADAFWNTLIKA